MLSTLDIVAVIIVLSYHVSLISDPGFLNFTFQGSVDTVFPGPFPPPYSYIFIL